MFTFKPGNDWGLQAVEHHDVIGGSGFYNKVYKTRALWVHKKTGRARIVWYNGKWSKEELTVKP